MRHTETREELEATLAERRQRLQELETKGAEALSEYDKKIAFGGNIELALTTSKRLLNNQIAWYSKRLAELDANGRQIALF